MEQPLFLNAGRHPVFAQRGGGAAGPAGWRGLCGAAARGVCVAGGRPAAGLDPSVRPCRSGYSDLVSGGAFQLATVYASGTLASSWEKLIQKAPSIGMCWVWIPAGGRRSTLHATRALLCTLSHPMHPTAHAVPRLQTPAHVHQQSRRRAPWRFEDPNGTHRCPVDAHIQGRRPPVGYVRMHLMHPPHATRASVTLQDKYGNTCAWGAGTGWRPGTASGSRPARPATWRSRRWSPWPRPPAAPTTASGAPGFWA